jgi:hypothetical protein
VGLEIIESNYNHETSMEETILVGKELSTLHFSS